MKKISITFLLLTIVSVAWSQNTFPSSGDAGIGTTSPNGSISSNQKGLHILNNNVSYLSLESTAGAGKKYTMYTSPAGGLVFWDASSSAIRGIIDANGNWGIGTNPDAKLHIDNPAGVNGTWLKLTEGVVDYRISNQGGRFKIREGTNDRFVIRSGGNVGIGVTSPDSKLVVDGEIRSEAVKVEVVNWPDYVFEPDYELRTLQETKEYIVANKHLPEIPPANEMETNGADLGDMNILLLKKIEELTLHQIKLLEKLEKQSERLQEVEKELQSLKK